MWPSSTGDSSFQISLFPTSQPPPPVPPLPLSMLLRCLAPPGINLPPLRLSNEAVPCLPVPISNHFESNADFGLPYFLQTPKVVSMPNELDVKPGRLFYFIGFLNFVRLRYMLLRIWGELFLKKTEASPQRPTKWSRKYHQCKRRRSRKWKQKVQENKRHST